MEKICFLFYVEIEFIKVLFHVAIVHKLFTLQQNCAVLSVYKTAHSPLSPFSVFSYNPPYNYLK